MTAHLPTLKLLEMALHQTDDNRLAFAATGQPVLVELSSGAETALDTPPMQLGVGQSVTVPQAVQDAFAEDGLTFTAADFGLWLMTQNTDDDEPIWFGSFTSFGIDLYGVHALSTDAISLTGGTFAELSLRIAVQIRGTAVERALVVVAGRLQHSSVIGMVDLNGIDMQFSLALDVSDVAELGRIIADPAQILDAAFSGRLTFTAAGRRLALGDHFSVEDSHCTFDIAVQSPANDRTLHLGDVDFTLQADAIGLIGAQIEQLDLACGYRAAGDRFFMRGAAAITLPPLLDSVLAEATSGTHVAGFFDLEHKPTAEGDLTTLKIGLEHLALDSAINILELTARDLALTFTYLDRVNANDAWTLRLSGSGCQSWSRLAARLGAAGIVALPDGANLPDLQGTLRLELAENATQGHVEIRLDFVQQGSGCIDTPPIPYDNLFGPLPMRVANTFLTLDVVFNDTGLGDWSVTGAGTLTTAGWLREPLPLRELAFAAAIQGSGTNVPTLFLSVSGGLPALRLPPLIPGMDPVEIFQPQSLHVTLGDVLHIEGAATLPLDSGGTTDLIDELHLPDAWRGIVDQISSVLTDFTATLDIRAPLTDSSQASTLSLVLEPTAPPEFRLMEAIGSVMNAVEGVTHAERDETKTLDSTNAEFFIATPHRITFDAAAGGDQGLALTLSLSLLCQVFGETFDVTAAFRFADGQPEFLLMAGLTDPIRLVIPNVHPDDVLGEVDLQQVIEMYNLDHHIDQINTDLFPTAQQGDARATLQALEDSIRGLFGEPGVASSLVFELRDFGLRVRLDRSPEISGTVRLVQMPGILNAVLPENGFDFGLGCSTQRIFISVKGPATRSDSGLFEPHETDPLLTIPLGRADGVDQFLYLFFGRFELEYSWATNAFGFLFDAAVVPVPDSLEGLNIAGNGVYFPGQSTFIKISKTVSTGYLPIVIPEWAFSFDRVASDTVDVDDARDELGLQIYVGTPDTRYFTGFFKEWSISPTYWLMQPAMTFDGGVIIGPHQPQSYATRADLFAALVEGEAGNQFLIHFEIDRLVAPILPSSIGVMLNPLVVLTGIGQLMPPWWIYPPYYMWDLYADQISFSVNLPHLLFFSIDFSRPLPSLSIAAMIELAALVMSGFSETIPLESELRQVWYITLDVRAALPLLDIMTGTDLPGLHLQFEVNIVDIANGLIRMGQNVGQIIEDGGDLVATFLDNPGDLVRMIPVEARHFAFPPPDAPNATYTLLGFNFSGSLFILTPEEFATELRVFHESKRIQPKGLAASQPEDRIITDVRIGPAPLTVTFGVRTHPHEPLITGYHWDFGDNTTSSGATPVHTYQSPGQYFVSVTTQAGGEAITSRMRIIAEGAHVTDPAGVALTGTLSYTLSVIKNPLGYFKPDDESLQTYAATTAADLFPKFRDQRTALLRAESERIDAIRRFIAIMWPIMLKTPLKEPVTRQQFWNRLGMKHQFERFEAVIRTASQGLQSIDVVGSLPRARLSRVQSTFEKILRAELTQVTILDSDMDFAATATRIVDDCLIISHSDGLGREPGRLDTDFSLKIVEKDERQQAYKKWLPPKHFEDMVKSIEVSMVRAMRTVEAGKIRTRADADRLRDILLSDVRNVLRTYAPGKTVASLDEVPYFELTPEKLAILLAQALATPAQIDIQAINVAVYNGTLTQNIMLTTLAAPTAEESPAIVREMTGYEIRAENPATGDVFAVPVPNPSPLYRVRMWRGVYQLLLIDGNDIIAEHPLPGWLTDDVHETPQKAEQLRNRLTVTGRFRDIPQQRASALTTWASQAEYVDEPYTKSIFARPEYELKPEGGLHGPLSVGDLLRRADGSYIVPDHPALLAGFVLHLAGWDNTVELRLAGLLAAPDSVFMNGYAEVNLELGPYELHLKGEFHLIHGPLWQDALASSDDFVADALNFSGLVEFRENGALKLRGEARGTLGTQTGDFALSLAVAYNNSWTLEVADTELLKLTTDMNLQIALSRTGSSFAFSVQSGLELEAWHAVPNMVEVEILPAITVCSQVPIVPPDYPDGPFFETVCVTTPAVTAEVPDFTNLSWSSIAALSGSDNTASLSIAAAPNDFSIVLVASVSGHDYTLSLPDLLAN